MKIQVASDLHLEFFERRFPGYRVVEPAGADLLVLAGDIHRHAEAVDAFMDWPCPILLLHGNHELYKADANASIALLRARTGGTGIQYLENDEAIVAGVRFLGCCLWTDYELDGDAVRVMAEAEAFISDHRLISTAQGLFRAADALEFHRHSRAWLERKLGEPFDGKTVVVSHHAPHPASVHPRFAGDTLNPCFVSDLTDLLRGADLWIHGHVHNSFDYKVGRTRVVANPRGYALNLRQAASPAEIEWENPAFDPKLLVEI